MNLRNLLHRATLRLVAPEVAQLEAVMHQERTRQAALAEQAQRDGGLYDPLLKRWIAHHASAT